MTAALRHHLHEHPAGHHDAPQAVNDVFSDLDGDATLAEYRRTRRPVPSRRRTHRRRRGA